MNQSWKKIIILFSLTIFFIFDQQKIYSSSQNWPIITRSNRSILPPDLQKQAQDTKMSVLRPTEAQRNVLYKNYPNGATLFAKNNDLATKFDVMIQAIQANPDLIEFFRKIQIKALNQLYAYIMKIYTNLNFINPGAIEKNDTTTANLTAYLSDEEKYAINQKKLLMNHFLNIIHNQFSNSIISYLPTIPADLAATFGQMFIENDCGIDLTEFTKQQTDPAIIQQQSVYINFLEKYLDFYQSYTQYLYKINEIGINQYCTIAQDLQTYLNKLQPNNAMNPAMFFYDAESMRSIRFIPFTAKNLPKKSELIPWAPSIVNAVVKNTTMNGHPIAYFKDADGHKVQEESKAQQLFLLTEVGTNLFEQELAAQPSWLNNENGCIRVLRGCLGDCSALVGMGILDETIERILEISLKKTTGQTPSKKVNSPKQKRPQAVEKNTPSQKKK